MCRKLCAIFALGVVLCLANRAYADDQTECWAVVEKAIEAMGGEENADKYKAVSFKGKGNFHGMGFEIPYTAEWFIQPPYQMKTTIDVDFQGQQFSIIMVLNKDRGWRSVAGEVTELDEEQLKNQKNELYADWLGTLIPLKDRTLKLTKIGDVKINDKDCFGMRVSKEGKPDVSLYFDKESHFLTKLESRVVDDMTGQEADQETLYSNYKESGGIKFATKQAIKRDGQLYIEVEMTDLKPLEKLEDDVFAMP